LEQSGAHVELSSDPLTISKASKLVLPGVGAFANAMNNLQSRNLVEPIKHAALSGTPLLGICLGMQLLLSQSEEFGITQGLGLIPGNVVAIPDHADDGELVKLPHIGWNKLHNKNPWESTILKGTPVDGAAYFVHSYMAVTDHEEDLLSVTSYAGNEITAVIQRQNIMGCQFHPEKSGEVGLSILRSFVSL
jgi:glutamine amidotransferase